MGVLENAAFRETGEGRQVNYLSIRFILATHESRTRPADEFVRMNE
jgi:hypothetical protein